MRKLRIKTGEKGQAEVIAIALGLVLLVGLIVAAGPKPPRSFVQTMEPGWASVEIREGMSYDKTWASVVDLIARKFDLEVISKEGSYIRTTWLYTWTGELREDYRVRVIIKFSPDKTKVDVKSEAHYLKGNDWVAGTDTALLKTLKTDIMGTVGRVTR